MNATQLRAMTAQQHREAAESFRLMLLEQHSLDYAELEALHNLAADLKDEHPGFAETQRHTTRREDGSIG